MESHCKKGKELMLRQYGYFSSSGAIPWTCGLSFRYAVVDALEASLSLHFQHTILFRFRTGFIPVLVCCTGLTRKFFPGYPIQQELETLNNIPLYNGN